MTVWVGVSRQKAGSPRVCKCVPALPPPHLAPAAPARPPGGGGGDLVAALRRPPVAFVSSDKGAGSIRACLMGTGGAGRALISSRLVVGASARPAQPHAGPHCRRIASRSNAGRQRALQLRGHRGGGAPSRRPRRPRPGAGAGRHEHPQGEPVHRGAQGHRQVHRAGAAPKLAGARNTACWVARPAKAALLHHRPRSPSMLTQRGRGILASDESNATTGAARRYRGCSRLVIRAGGHLLRSDRWHASMRQPPVPPSRSRRQAPGERGRGEHGGQPARLAPAAVHRARRPRPTSHVN